MLVIRLARTGRNKYPTYRIVAAESARAATGKHVAVLGNYNPHTKELVIKRDETLARLQHGAQPSNTVIKLLQREKVELPEWVKLKTKAPKPVEAKVEESPDVTEAEAAEDAGEAPVVEASADETRVAEVVESAASDAVEPNINDTETAAKDEAQVEATEAAQDAGAEAAKEA